MLDLTAQTWTEDMAETAVDIRTMVDSGAKQAGVGLILIMQDDSQLTLYGSYRTHTWNLSIDARLGPI